MGSVPVRFSEGAFENLNCDGIEGSNAIPRGKSYSMENRNKIFADV